MSWAFENIPKRLLCYWGAASPMSYMRYLTLRSFVALNPDWTVRLYMPLMPLQGGVPWESGERTQSYSGRDWLWRVFSLPRLEVEILRFRNNHLSNEVHRSDFVRYGKLAEDGGVWSDMDILYLRPMSAMRPTADLPADIRAGICWRESVIGKGSHHHHIGFLMGAPGGRFWSAVDVRCQERINKGAVSGYQDIGRGLLDEIAPWDEQFLKQKVGNIDKNVVYPIAPRFLDYVYEPDTNVHMDMDSSIGLHWYSGHKKSFQAQEGLAENSFFMRSVANSAEAVQ